MLVIQRNGQTTVITGWRAWLLGGVALAGTALLLAAITFVMVGVAVTLGVVLMIVLPLVIGAAILASAFQRRGA
jgi:hypothetical protein